MSRHPRPICRLPRRIRTVLAAVLALALALPGPAPAGVVYVDQDTYRLDNGKPVTGMWEIAEKLAYTRDVAIVVMEPKSSASLVQDLLQLLATLKVPAVLTKKADYKVLLERGVLRPTPTPAAP